MGRRGFRQCQGKKGMSWSRKDDSGTMVDPEARARGYGKSRQSNSGGTFLVVDSWSREPLSLSVKHSKSSRWVAGSVFVGGCMLQKSG
jgi:hypothetical protein